MNKYFGKCIGFNFCLKSLSTWFMISFMFSACEFLQLFFQQFLLFLSICKTPNLIKSIIK